MEQETEVTKVIFRQFRTKQREVIALFPELPGDTEPYTCLSYMHVGQHGSASRALVNYTDHAWPSAYADLVAELTSLGYNLKILRRWTSAMDETRRAALKAMDGTCKVQEAPNG
jgi:hypothetical protein